MSDYKEIFIPRSIRFQIFSNGRYIRSYNSLLTNFSVEDVISAINSGSLAVWLNDIGRPKKAKLLIDEFGQSNQLCAFEKDDYIKVINFFFGHNESFIPRFSDIKNLWESDEKYKTNLSIFISDMLLIDNQKIINDELQKIIDKENISEPYDLEESIKILSLLKESNYKNGNYNIGLMFEFAIICCDICNSHDFKTQCDKITNYISNTSSADLKSYIGLISAIIFESEHLWERAKERYNFFAEKFLFARQREKLIETEGEDVTERNHKKNDLITFILRKKRIYMPFNMGDMRVLVLAQNFLYLK